MNRLVVFLAIIIVCSFGHAFADINISLNPVIELNEKSREEILDLRRQYVDEVPELAPEKYEPDKGIFGRMEDGRPWWGFLGICYYGPGEKSIWGNSKESRFILNPYLLVGVEEAQAIIVNGPSLTPDEFYPQPTQLTWEDQGAWGQVTYNVTDFSAALIRYRSDGPQDLYLSDYNARDFGFNYLVIDSALSQNVQAVFDQVIPIKQFIHVGQSCGYPGGCNNRSPFQSELKIIWRQLPARIYIKLWKEMPADIAEKSDMDFMIDLN